jgi:hypothetical protein
VCVITPFFSLKEVEIARNLLARYNELQHMCTIAGWMEHLGGEQRYVFNLWLHSLLSLTGGGIGREFGVDGPSFRL